MKFSDSHIRHLVIGCTLLLLPSLAMADGRRTSEQALERLRYLKEMFHGCRIEIHPDKPRHVQGQDFYLEYRITCDQYRPKPWEGANVNKRTTLNKDGKPVGHAIFDVTDGFFRDSARTFEGNFAVDCFWDRDDRPYSAFRYLSPGHYEGVFDGGTMTAQFSFDIDPVPDSLQSVWETFSQLQRLHLRYNHPRERLDVDSALAIMRTFIARPMGSMWRKEALSSGLGILQTPQRSYPRSLSDSLICDSSLYALADEPEQPVEGTVNEALMQCESGRLRGVARFAWLNAFADRVHNPELSASVRQTAKELLAEDEQRSRNVGHDRK
jgi:hypothetical protein